MQWKWHLDGKVAYEYLVFNRNMCRYSTNNYCTIIIHDCELKNNHGSRIYCCADDLNYGVDIE